MASSNLNHWFTLTPRPTPLPQRKKAPPCGGAFLNSVRTRAGSAAGAVLLMTGILALTIRILLLLARLLAAALLLAGSVVRILVLLTRILVLLARVLVLVRHCGLPC
jgi:hypothetical protein